MPRIEVGRSYTPTELRTLIGQAEADELKLTGYVLQFDALSNTYQVVHWTDASQPFRQDGNRAQRRQVQKTVGKEAFGKLDPIVKRSAVSRVDSLTAKWLLEMKAAGGLPGFQSGVAPEGSTTAEKEDAERRAAVERRMMDEKIQEIVGAAWKEGRTEITADIVRQVAAHFLGEAEAKHEAKLDKQITRHEG